MIGSSIYTAEIIPTEDPRSNRICANFDSRSKAMVYVSECIDALFPDTDNCDVAAQLWSYGSVELPGYTVRVQSWLCQCQDGAVCSFCDWRNRARHVHSVIRSRGKGKLVSICDGRKVRARESATGELQDEVFELREEVERLGTDFLQELCDTQDF